MSVLNWKRATDLPMAYLKVLLYGDSGVGKTWTASTAPRPVYLLTEPNGLPTILAANPDAVVVQADEGHGGLDTVRQFLQAARDGSLARETGCESVILDSLNELQRMLKDEIMATKKGGHTAESFTLQDWGVLNDKMRAMVRVFRDLPFHVVGLTHADVDQEEDGPRWLSPYFMGQSIPREIGGYFSVVGYQYRKQVKAEDGGATTTTRHVLLQGPPTVVCKGLHGLDAVEVPDLSVWMDKINRGRKARSTRQNGGK